MSADGYKSITHEARKGISSAFVRLRHEEIIAGLSFYSSNKLSIPFDKTSHSRGAQENELSELVCLNKFRRSELSEWHDAMYFILLLTKNAEI